RFRQRTRPARSRGVRRPRDHPYRRRRPLPAGRAWRRAGVRGETRGLASADARRWPARDVARRCCPGCRRRVRLRAAARRRPGAPRAGDELSVLLFADPQVKSTADIDYYARDIVEPLLAGDGAADLGISLGDIVDDVVALYPGINAVTRRLGV